MRDVADLESAILDGEVASDMIRGGNRLVGIRVRYPVEYRSSIEKLKSPRITSPTGMTVPLSSIAELEMDEGMTEVRRDNLRNTAAVTARLSGRDLGSAMKEIQGRLFKEVPMPPGTALATIFGMLPLALGIGSGAEMLQPLAIAVIGGVGISMILSLLITPVIFYLLRVQRSGITK